MPAARKPVDADDAPLKRLGGGRWQTRDERFSIEPQSGTWVIVDAEQTDDLGLPLVRGPFPSLTAAKDAIASARSSGPAESPLADRIERRREAPAERARKLPAGPVEPRPTKPAPPADREDDKDPKPKGRRPKRDGGRVSREAAAEPSWLDALDPGDRATARRLLRRLTEQGATDAEGLVRRDLVGDVPAVAAYAVGRLLAELGDDADPTAVAEALADGRDDGLDVRWRLVDGDGRPILLESLGRRGRR